MITDRAELLGECSVVWSVAARDEAEETDCLFGVFIVLFSLPCEASLVASVQGYIFYLVCVRGVLEPLLRGFLHGGGGESGSVLLYFWCTFGQVDAGFTEISTAPFPRCCAVRCSHVTLESTRLSPRSPSI